MVLSPGATHPPCGETQVFPRCPQPSVTPVPSPIPSDPRDLTWTHWPPCSPQTCQGACPGTPTAASPSYQAPVTSRRGPCLIFCGLSSTRKPAAEGRGCRAVSLEHSGSAVSVPTVLTGHIWALPLLWPSSTLLQALSTATPEPSHWTEPPCHAPQQQTVTQGPGPVTPLQEQGSAPHRLNSREGTPPAMWHHEETKPHPPGTRLFQNVLATEKTQHFHLVILSREE